MDTRKKAKIVADALTNRELWEILVPTVRPDGRPFHARFHRVWDKEVEKISGGITLVHPTKGTWLHQGERYEERMIPVRILCTEEQISTIIDFTIVYYEQIAVMAYRISDKVILRHKDDK